MKATDINILNLLHLRSVRLARGASARPFLFLLCAVRFFRHTAAPTER